MTRVPVLLAALALALPSCGGKSKNEQTTPAGAHSGDGAQGIGQGTGDPANMDPAGDGTGPDGTGGPGVDGSNSAGSGGDGPAGNPSDGPAAGDETAATIEPPTLDKSPAEIAQAVESHLTEGNKALAEDRPDDAIMSARRALKEDEVNVRAMVMLAHAYYAKGYYDKAEAILDIALKRPDGPRNHQLHFLQGLVYEKTDRPEQALASYEKAVNVNADYKSGLMNLGAMYLQRKRYQEAIQVYERLTGGLADRKPGTWNNLGSAYRGYSVDLRGDAAARAQYLKKAESAYKQATTAGKSYGPPYYNLGLLYLDADPFPGPDGKDLDYLKRLELARTYFREYRGLPGADFDKVDSQDEVANKLYDREVKRREKAAERERKAREREEKKKKREAAGGGT